MPLPNPSVAMIPDALHEAVSRWWERAGALPALAGAYAGLPEALRDELPRVVAGSEFIGAALIQDVESLAWLGRHEDPSLARVANDEYERRASAAATTADAQHLLREWRRREMLRIAWHDIAGRASVTDTLRAVSDLADGCIRAAAAAARRYLDATFGRPRNAQAVEVPLIVVAMGKLGGRELNFSSDIDLVFLYAEAGETDGVRPADNSEYFNSLGREMIRLLDARTEVRMLQGDALLVAARGIDNLPGRHRTVSVDPVALSPTVCSGRIGDLFTVAVLLCW